MVEEKPKTRSTQPTEAAPAFMSSVFALMDVYLNKMLVRPHKHNTTITIRLQYLWPDRKQHCQLQVFSQ